MSKEINSKKLPSSDWDWLEENAYWNRNAAAKWFTPLLDLERGLALIERTKRIDIRLANAQLQRTEETLESKNLVNLRGFGKLRKLLPPRKLDDEGLKHICELGKLTHLYLSGENFTNEGLKNLSNLTKLKHFSTEWLPDGDDTIKILAALPKLNYLELQVTNVRNDDLIPLINSNIKKLNIGCKNVNADALRHVGQIKSLESLMLGNSNTQKITDDSLIQIQGLTNLKRLTLKLTEVTENGLVHLEPLKSLKFLQLKREMCKSQAAKDLKKKIPGLAIKENA